MRIPMYSVMGGAPVGCSPRIKGGVPGRAIVKFLHFCIMVVECRFGRAAFLFLFLGSMLAISHTKWPVCALSWLECI